jgi:uncharacterized protein (TIGR02186 family)
MTEDRSLSIMIGLFVWGACMAALVLCLAPWAEAALGPDPYCRLSKDHICVDATYTGDTISVSGVADPGAQVIIKVASPAASMKLARKAKVGPIWMNVSDVEFGNTPAFYQVNCTGALEPLLPAALLDSLGLGYDGLKHQMQLSPAAENTEVNFKEFIGLKESEGLYKVRPDSVRVDGKGQFQSTFIWPSNAPAGPYQVTVYEVKDGRVLHQATSQVVVEKVGLIRWLANMAQHDGATYGLLAIASALGAGLVVGFVFKGAKAH